MEIRHILFVVLMIGSAKVNGLQRNFFRYGSLSGDRNLTEGNDETIAVDLPAGVPFRYYGENHTTVHIQTNGVLSFNNGIPEPVRMKRFNVFPLNPIWNQVKQVNALIAPFWADVDTSDGRGSVYYRSSSSVADIKNATKIVRANFPRYPTFEAAWVLVVTWNNVSFYGHDNTSSTDPRNTFQAVLITDGESSFVFLFYDDIKWVAGALLGGDAETGYTEDPGARALVGFNKGDGNTSFTDGFPITRTVLPRRTNIGNVAQLGTYAYQVDQDIKEAGCSDEESEIVTYPSSGSILGGEKIYLYGPCWNESNTLLCEFWTMGATATLLQNISGTVVNETTAYCRPSNFSTAEAIDIRVSQDGGETFPYSGEYQLYQMTSTVTATTPEMVQDGGLEGWIIAIIVVGCFLAVAAVLAILGYLYQTRMRRKGAKKVPQEDKDTAEEL